MRYRLTFLIPVLSVLSWGAVTVFALQPDDKGQTEEQRGERRSIQAVRWTQSPPVIDGVLSEEMWMRLPPATNFTQKEPREGQTATQRTEVRFSYDANALYIGAIMYVDDPAEIQSTLSRRDNAGNSERLLISLDTYLDNRTAYTFGITADGVRLDYYHPSDAEHSRDYSFNPVWEAQVTRSQEAWFAEIRIPFSQLRFNDRNIQLWGLNLNRYIPSRNEDVYWVMIPKNDAGWSSRFGRLTGIEGIRPSSRIELTPYAVGDLTISRGGNATDPFYDRMAWRGNAGLDLKMGLGPNLTLDATVNPDFGQVEADPAEVNLSAYETYYSEQRPFFVEGNPLLRGEGPEYFYSRRIGAKPRMLPGGVYVDHISNTTILGASKLSGRLASGLSIAALSAVTEREFVNTYDPRTGTYEQSMIEPLTGYGVLRMQQELDEENGSVVGVVLTGVSRDLTSPESKALLPRDAAGGGVDWKLRFDRASYELQGNAGYSHLVGSKEAVDLVQRSSTHFFQRPDADHITYDPQRTSLSGITAGLRFEKISGGNWLWGLGGSTESPGFNINDAGILSAADDIDTWARLTYRENIPGRVFHSYRATFSMSSGWNYGWIRQYAATGLTLQATWKNFYNSSISIDYGFGALNDHLTRGGPLMRSREGWNIYASLSNSYAEDLRWNAWSAYFSDALGSRRWSAGAMSSLRTQGRVEFSVEPTFEQNINVRQYVTSTPDGPAATYGQRYIFARIEQTTISARFRFGYAFSPDLTLELYAEPFAASGAWSAYGALAAPASEHLRLYGEDAHSDIDYDPERAVYTLTDEHGTFELPDPDFNVLSFRSNVVLRWEWVRGSTLFLVWQQNRAAYDRDGSTVAPRDLFRSFDSPGDNFIALKISYWIPVT